MAILDQNGFMTSRGDSVSASRCLLGRYLWCNTYGMLARTRKIARYVASLLLLAMSYSAVCGTNGFVQKVICFSISGHIAVELSQGDQCAQFIEEHPTTPALGGVEIGKLTYCGSCRDVSLQNFQASNSSDFYDRTWLTNLPAPSDVIFVVSPAIVL